MCGAVFSTTVASTIRQAQNTRNFIKTRRSEIQDLRRQDKTVRFMLRVQEQVPVRD